MIKLGIDLDNVCSGSVTDQSLFHVEIHLLKSIPARYVIITSQTLKAYTSIGIVLAFCELSTLDRYLLLGIRNEPS